LAINEALSFVKIDKKEILKETLGEQNYRLYHNINKVQEFKGIQARVPFMFDIN